MNLLDLLDAPEPIVAPAIRAGWKVRALDGREGTVLAYSAQTERACVIFDGIKTPPGGWWLNRVELEAIGAQEIESVAEAGLQPDRAARHVSAVGATHVAATGCVHRWKPTLTVWPGETWERHTRTCAVCKEVRGRE